VRLIIVVGLSLLLARALFGPAGLAVAFGLWAVALVAFVSAAEGAARDREP
jgi:hypothetical protein